MDFSGINQMGHKVVVFYNDTSKSVHWVDDWKDVVITKASIRD